MSARVEIVQARQKHAMLLAADMQPNDIAEVLAGGHEPLDSILKSLHASSSAYTLFVDGELLAMYGVAPVTLVGEVAIAWLLTSNAVVRHRKTFVKLARSELHRLHQSYPYLMNGVPLFYGSAHRWLKSIGFKFGQEVKIGAEKFFVITHEETNHEEEENAYQDSLRWRSGKESRQVTA